MNRNLILAFIISIGIYIGWFYWVQKTHPQPAAVTAAQAQTQAPAQQQSPSDIKPQPAAKSSPQRTDFQAGPLEKTDAQIADEQKQEPSQEWLDKAIRHKTSKADILIHPEGGGVVGFLYHGPLGPVELVTHARPGFLSSMSGLMYTQEQSEPDTVRLTAKLATDVFVEKTYRWSNEGGLNTLEIKVTNNSKTPFELGAWKMRFGPGIGTVPSEKSENAKMTKAGFAIQEDGRKHPTLMDMPKKTPSGKWLWAGLHNRYFLAAAMPEGWENTAIEFSETEYGKKEKAPSIALPAEAKSILAPGQSKTWKLDYYIGPKDYRALQAMGHGLDRSVEFGFFAPLGKLALSVMYKLHAVLGNYGWSIVVFTVLLQIVMFPLTWKSTKTTIIMKKLQPELKKIQEKYKDNPQRLNMEMMDLYRRNDANPLSGCLPMLLQLPIFVALFTALRNSWDLHGAAFVFWLKDLSAKDPYYILPITMGAVMFLQQKMSPVAGDDTQQSIMKWMPIVMTFMFLGFPSGLVLYWLTSSILGFILQAYMQKKLA